MSSLWGTVFDLEIDRSAISCVGLSSAHRAIAEIRRALKSGGRFLFTPYADDHSSAATSRLGPDGLTIYIKGGTVVGAWAICFYGQGDVQNMLAEGWTIESMKKVEITEMATESSDVHAERRVIAAKKGR